MKREITRFLSLFGLNVSLTPIPLFQLENRLSRDIYLSSCSCQVVLRRSACLSRSDRNAICMRASRPQNMALYSSPEFMPIRRSQEKRLSSPAEKKGMDGTPSKRGK